VSRFTEVNEIDMMYISYALDNNDEEADQETACAVNESIDKFCCMMEETVTWLKSEEIQNFMKDIDDFLGQ